MKTTFTLLFFLVLKTASFSQGRVVINEYLPWPSNGCGATTEYVELMNFGPGPMNIGCYILTDGDYAITIPANTILQPGAYYTISGTSTITYPCGSIDSTIHPQLNWNTCNCTNVPIPTTGDGFMTDGGGASEQLVLLDPTLKVIDAVVRSSPETSSAITTSTAGGQCTSRSFDLDTMTIDYETIGESAGRGNSFSRKLDGDCHWLKDTHESGNASNNHPGDVSDVTYSFNYTQTQACPDNGSVAVTVSASDYSDVFAMSYILAFDSDSNDIFEFTDSYIYDTVTNPNSIAVGNLIEGTYRLTVASPNGCYLQTFPFSILDCIVVLPVRLVSFGVQQNNNRVECRWSIENSQDLKYVTIERSTDGISFTSFSTIQAPPNTRGVWNHNYSFTEANTTMPYFRLRMNSQNGKETFSPIVNLSSRGFTVNRVWPNPVKDLLYAESSFASSGIVEYRIFNMSNKLLAKADISVRAGVNSFMIPVQHLSPDIYQLIIQDKNHPEGTVRLRFVKL